MNKITWAQLMSVVTKKINKDKLRIKLKKLSRMKRTKLMKTILFKYKMNKNKYKMNKNKYKMNKNQMLLKKKKKNQILPILIIMNSKQQSSRHNNSSSLF